MDSNKTKSIAKLSVFTIAIMNVTAVVSLRGLPAEAEYGLSSAFYYLFAALVFLIPTSLVIKKAVSSAGSARLSASVWASLPSGCNGSKIPSGIQRC